MIAGAPSLTGPTDPWGTDPFGIGNLGVPVAVSSASVIVFQCDTTCTGHNLTYVPSRAETRRRALDRKRLLSWFNVLDRMDEQRHAPGAELLRIPTAKAMAPKSRAPSVGRVCSGSSRYRVLRPSA
jgi:hypothetical protein